MVGGRGSGESRTGNDGRWCGSGGSSERAWERWERWEIAPEPPKGDKLQVEGEVIGKR